MGCDIHCYVEKMNEAGVWESINQPEPNPYYDERFPNDEPKLRLEEPFDIDRNYNLFSILADVRNGVGFAGIDTGDYITPIAQPRGLPADVSAVIRAESDRWNGDGHSHSWLTVAEIDAYEWNGSIVHRGYVNGLTYAQWNKRGVPESSCGDVAGGLTRTVSNAEMEALLNKPVLVADMRHIYTRIEWTTTRASAAWTFYRTTLPLLRKVGPADKVRLVFWFDS